MRKTYLDRLLKASPSLWLTAAMLLLVAVAFSLYVRAEKQIDRANEQRFSSVILANHLRQTSDDLTRMARSYAVAGDPRYKKHYQDILDIRDGKKPRPEGYFRSYWDLVLADPKFQQAGDGQAVALLDLMREAGFTDDEFRKLAEAKANSDDLTATEFKAMKLIETGDPEAEANRAKARLMLNDAPYIQAKAAITRPINTAFELMDKRTSEQVQATESMAMVFRAIFVLCTLVAIFMLWRAYAAIRKILGGAAREVHAHIERIGQGDLSSPIPVAPGMEGSVLAGLLSMQRSLQTSQLRQRAIFSASPDAILISNAHGLITQTNHQVESLLGYTADELIGLSIETLVPEKLRTRHSKRRAEFAASPAGRRMGHGLEVKARRKDGSEVDAEVSLSRIETDQGSLIVSAVHDISERKQAEDRIRRLNQLYAALSQCNQAIVRCTSEEELFPQISRDVVVFGGMKMAWIGMVDESSLRIRPLASYGAAQAYLDSIEISIDANDPLGQGPTGTAVREDQPFWCQDFLNDTRTSAWQDAASRFGLAASAALPLHRDGKTVGTFNLYAAEVNAFDEDVRKLLLEMAEDISFALDNFAREAARKAAETALRTSQERMALFITHSPAAIAMFDHEMRYLGASNRWLSDYDIGDTKIIGRSHYDIFPGLPERWKLIHQRCLGGAVEKCENDPFPRADGRTDWVRWEIRPWHAADGAIGGLIIFSEVVTQNVQAEEQLRIAAAAFESQEGMVITDQNGIVLRVNRSFTEITGYAPDEIIGRTPGMLKSDRHTAEFYREMWNTLLNTGVWQGEIWDRRKNGEVYPKWLTISAVKDLKGAVTHYVGTHFDITERKQAEARINELAYFDQLTGLPNRTLLLDRLKQAMAASLRSGNFGALLLIDLDNFKTLNDTLGHDMGDRLLKQVAQRLNTCVREEDTVARLGGDEFVVVLASLSAVQSDAAAQTEVVGEKLRSALNHPYQLGNVTYSGTPSIGATLFRGHLAPIDDLMKQADLAMYKAKAAGHNQVRFFDPAMETAVLARLEAEKDLRHALDEKQFLLYYQPQIVGEGQLTGAEVLVRWKQPERGMVSPAEFIPLAEETGLILPLGLWVLETACIELASWATRPAMAHLTVAVNVSAHQFQEPDFVDKVLAVLERTGANPQRLKLELTESLLVNNVEDIIAKMFMLKARGVGFSLDDFGTGYSSLSYLKRLPLDQLKIDQSFVRDVMSDPNDAAIARTVIALAHSLGLGVIAEGVETAAQRDFLAISGCHAYQGYFFSRPLPVEDFIKFAQITAGC